MPKRATTEQTGFTPVYDQILQEYGAICALIFGRIWRYCQMKQKKCYATIETIADDLHLNRTTVMHHIKTLVKGGYLIDATPNLRNHPHTYLDAGKVRATEELSNRRINGSKSPTSINSPTVGNNDSTDVNNDSAVANYDTTVANSDMKIEEVRKDGKRVLVPTEVGNGSESEGEDQSSSLSKDYDIEEAQDEDKVSEDAIEEDQGEGYMTPNKDHKNWEIPEGQLQDLVLSIGGAKWFKTGEKERFKRIEERRNYPYEDYTSDHAQYPDFLNAIINWAANKNGNGIQLTVANILTAFENEDRFNEFIVQQKRKQAKSEHTPNYGNRPRGRW